MRETRYWMRNSFDRAFVTVQYTDKTTETEKEVTEKFTVDVIDGIWKVRLPSF